MGGYEGSEGGYAVPTYKVPDGSAWYHFLHGNVPGHQIDFMYRAEVPQGPLTRQHFSHLSRLIKYIEPHTNNPYAFAIGNLSRDDTQYEPGHGGVALIFGFRITGVTDHAGRQDPPFAHGIATVDRHFDVRAFSSAARSFYNHLFSRSGFENPSTVLYQEYVRFASKKPEVLPTVLKAYVDDFNDLPLPTASSLSSKWLANEAEQPKRVVIVHPNDAPFDVLAACAARFAAMLYQSDIKWSAISNGRESDLPSGVTVRLVAKRDSVGHDLGGLVLGIDEVPEEEEGIAELFKARPAKHAEAAPVQGWRARMQAQAGGPTSTPPPPPSGRSVVEGLPIERIDPSRGDEPRPVSDPQPGLAGMPPAPPSNPEVNGGARPWMNRSREAKDVKVDGTESLGSEAALDPPAAGLGLAGAAVDAGVAPAIEGGLRLNAEGREAPALGKAIATVEPSTGADQPRSRLWLWLGLGLLVAAAVPVAMWAGNKPGAETGASSGAAPPSTNPGLSSSPTVPTSTSPSAPQPEPSPKNTSELPNNVAPPSAPTGLAPPPSPEIPSTPPSKPPKGPQTNPKGSGRPPSTAATNTTSDTAPQRPPPPPPKPTSASDLPPPY